MSCSATRSATSKVKAYSGYPLSVAVPIVAQHPHVAMAAATSGATNLLLAVGCRDDADLYDYVAHRLGPIDGVQAVQIAPVIRTVKRAGALLEPAPRH